MTTREGYTLIITDEMRTTLATVKDVVNNSGSVELTCNLAARYSNDASWMGYSELMSVALQDLAHSLSDRETWLDGSYDRPLVVSNSISGFAVVASGALESDIGRLAGMIKLAQVGVIDLILASPFCVHSSAVSDIIKRSIKPHFKPSIIENTLEIT